MTTVGTYGMNETDPLVLSPITGRPNESSIRTYTSSSWIDNRLHTFLLVLMFLCCAYIAHLGHKILENVQDKYSPASTTSSTHYLQQQQIVPTVSQLSLKSPPNQRTLHETLVLVVYGPADDEWQRAIAEKVAEGAESIDSTIVRLKTVETATFQDVLDANAIIIGSPVHNANTHPQVQTWINEWDFQYDLSDKIGAAFATAGGMSAGEEGTLISILQSLMIFRLIIVGGDTWRSAFGASAITNEAPFSTQDEDVDQYFADICYQADDQVVHPMFLAKARGLGARVATVAKRFHASS